MFPPFVFWELGSFEMLMLQKVRDLSLLVYQKMYWEREKFSLGNRQRSCFRGFGGKSSQRQGKETREGSALMFFRCPGCFHTE